MGILIPVVKPTKSLIILYLVTAYQINRRKKQNESDQNK